MAFQLSNGQGSVFPNQKTSDNQPDLKGSFRGLDGVLYDLALWKKTSRDGKQFLSVKVSEFRGRDDNSTAAMLRGAEQLAAHEEAYRRSQEERHNAPQQQPQYQPVVAPTAPVVAEEERDDLPF